ALAPARTQLLPFLTPRLRYPHLPLLYEHHPHDESPASCLVNTRDLRCDVARRWLKCRDSRRPSESCRDGSARETRGCCPSQDSHRPALTVSVLPAEHPFPKRNAYSFSACN